MCRRTETLLARYRTVRSHSELICAPLALEDYVPSPWPR